MAERPNPLAVSRIGSGPEVLLVHGGAAPRATWRGLESLREGWTVVTVHRRGFSPSPMARQDFEVDADDLLTLLDRRPHLVAHSYGTLGVLLAAERCPEQVRSLTLIEPPLFFLAPNDLDVDRLQLLGDAVLLDGLAADPGLLREFLGVAGVTGLDDGPLPERVAQVVTRAHGSRLPGEARPSLETLRAAGIPSLVASGGHDRALEAISDALALRLVAARLVCPGAGHFVPRAPGFSEGLAAFLAEH